MDIPGRYLYTTTIAGDIAGNTLFYALAAVGDAKNATVRGGLLGLAAGVGGSLSA